MQENQLFELKSFIKKHAHFIYEYINTKILHDIGVMHPDYFIKVIEDVLIHNSEAIKKEKCLTYNIFPYFIFTTLCGNATIAYTSLRAETINFSALDKEAHVYYNYARFSLQNDALCIELMQSKMGGMPIDGDIVKFTKRVPIQHTGLEAFISEQKREQSLLSLSSQNIRKNIQKIEL